MTTLTSTERWKLLVVRAKLKGTYQSLIEPCGAFRRYLDECCQGLQPWQDRGRACTEEKSYSSYLSYLSLDEDD